jgi:hypothetical protein
MRIDSTVCERVAAVALGVVTLAAGVLLAAFMWAFGTPSELWAVVRLDGVHAVPWMPMETCYATRFTHAAFRRIRIGESADEVRAALGEPLTMTWLVGPPSGGVVGFRRDGVRWVTSRTLDIQAFAGTPMESLDTLRPHITSEHWSYARSCVPDDSRRSRTVSFAGGRLTSLSAGVYYD